MTGAPFDLSAALPVPGLDAVAAGSALLFTGPTAATERVAEAIVRDGLATGDPAVFLRTTRGAVPVPEGSAVPLHLIDCSGDGDGDGDEGELPGTVVRHDVASPASITELGIAAVRGFRDVASTPTRLVVHSLSDLVAATDRHRAFYFLQVLTGRVAAAGHLAAVTVDPALTGRRAVDTIEAQFDAVVEVEAGEGSAPPSVRVFGLDAAPPRWFELTD
jgi:acetolactate synthase regulatory subunit